MILCVKASFSTLGTGLLDESLLSRPGGLVFADADGDGPKANSLAAAIYGVAIPARFYQFTDSEHYFSHANNPYDSGFNGFRAEGPQPSDLLVSSGKKLRSYGPLSFFYWYTLINGETCRNALQWWWRTPWRKGGNLILHHRLFRFRQRLRCPVTEQRSEYLAFHPAAQWICPNWPDSRQVCGRITFIVMFSTSIVSLQIWRSPSGRWRLSRIDCWTLWPFYIRPFRVYLLYWYMVFSIILVTRAAFGSRLFGLETFFCWPTKNRRDTLENVYERT